MGVRRLSCGCALPSGTRISDSITSGGRHFQPFPTRLPLRAQLNLGKSRLESRIGELARDRRVYPYVVATVARGGDGVFRQEGCSPNLQGGIITLCDCKHHMRSSSYFADYRGVWIAGLTRGGLTAKHRRYLFYLMFARPVTSHAELWKSLRATTRMAKSARLDPLGDIYEPVRSGLEGDECFAADNYRRPVAGHVHQHVWRRDLEQTYRKTRRRPVLLKGEPILSFIWSLPRLWLSERAGPLPRTPGRSENIAAFMNRLREESL